jgi:asparagine synthase (glutamine-hydrolysing)
MCGITGFVNAQHPQTEERLSQIIGQMTGSIFHRGPDDSGMWIDPNAGVVLGFRRLAILDLSPNGHQPMLSSNERYVIIFNGEIYNFSDLRESLTKLGHTFRGTSDTEIVLAGIVEWGVEQTVRKLNGMFAIALWDKQERTLCLIRDRLGIKPLYYGWQNGEFLFGSELKTLCAHPAFNAEIDRDALSLYLKYTYIPAPYSIYCGIKKLLPGTLLYIKFDQPQPLENVHAYWSAMEAVANGVQNRFHGADQDAVDELDVLLRESVRLRMIADVPLGAFLSGGIDSSLIVALMQAQSNRPVKTFTIGFHESGFNEAVYAKEVARHLRTDHTELYVSPNEAMSVIPKLPTLYDEPFGDSSQIPTYLVSKLAREHVTVSLSGDGGDELFGGYSRYFRAKNVWTSMGWIPFSARRGLGGLSAGISNYIAKKGGDATASLNTKFFFLSEVLGAKNPENLYLRLVSQWENPEQLVVNGREPLTLLDTLGRSPAGLNYIEKMMYLDLVTYLPEDILVKLDRASMGVSLEGRVPYLDDHRVVEFAWRLPFEMKVRDGKGKWIMRQVLYRYVPKKMIERPKMGFGVPIVSWLRGPLREWAEALLDEKRIEHEGYLNPSLIQKRWSEHKKNLKNWQYPLWTVLMFQSWLEQAGALKGRHD